NPTCLLVSRKKALIPQASTQTNASPTSYSSIWKGRSQAASAGSKPITPNRKSSLLVKPSIPPQSWTPIATEPQTTCRNPPPVSSSITPFFHFSLPLPPTITVDIRSTPNIRRIKSLNRTTNIL